MTNIINQTYKVTKYLPLKIKIYRFISNLIIKILFPYKKSLFRNSFLQFLNSYIEIIINNKTLKFKDGNERLYLDLSTHYIIEKDLINWIDTFSEKDVFFDIGSNVGLFSIYAAKKNINTGCFEGHFGNLDDFNYNVLLNNVSKKILIIPTLLGTENNKTNFYLRDLTSSSAKSEIDHKKNIYGNDVTESLKISCISLNLDYLIDQKIVPLPTKVKIDVDGAEFLIMKGFKKYLGKVDEIMIEMYENSADYWKCYRENKKNKSINTNFIKKSYFEKTNNKNPYYDEIKEILMKNNFIEKQTYGNNVIFKRKI